MSVYCVAELSMKVSLLTSWTQSILSHVTNLYQQEVSPTSSKSKKYLHIFLFSLLNRKIQQRVALKTTGREIRLLYVASSASPCALLQQVCLLNNKVLGIVTLLDYMQNT